MPRFRTLMVLGAVLGSSCADGGASTTTDSSLDVSEASGDKLARVEATWKFTSSKVDIGIVLRTTLGEACKTIAHVRIDETLSDANVYQTMELECDVLRVDPDGDLVMFDNATGHDWAHEAIEVDTDREIVRLGPWRDANATRYLFELDAPDCPEDDCTCPRLVRRAGGEVMTLELAHVCD